MLLLVLAVVGVLVVIVCLRRWLVWLAVAALFGVGVPGLIVSVLLFASWLRAMR